jgi:hypothetical protein
MGVIPRDSRTAKAAGTNSLLLNISISPPFTFSEVERSTAAETESRASPVLDLQAFGRHANKLLTDQVHPFQLS